jgi:hypothetical protein
MTAFIESVAPYVSWIALAVSVGAILSVWAGTRSLRTLSAKRKDVFAEQPVEKPSALANPFYLRLKSLREQKGVADPDVDLFMAVFENDVDKLQRALDAGANVNVTDLELARKYGLDLGAKPT